MAGFVPQLLQVQTVQLCLEGIRTRIQSPVCNTNSGPSEQPVLEPKAAAAVATMGQSERSTQGEEGAAAC